MHELIVRTAIAARVSQNDPHAAETRIVYELGLCEAQARIDVVTINGQLIGWEIKTRSDRLSRLPRQEAVYSRVFDRMWLVAADRHIERALPMIPEWWGVLQISDAVDGCSLQLVRRARRNRNVDPHSLVRLLWRDEALEELAALGLADGLHRAPRRILWQRLADATPLVITDARLRARVRERLKHRDGWRAGRLPAADDGLT